MLTIGSGVLAIFAMSGLGNILFMRGLLGSAEESRGRRSAPATRRRRGLAGRGAVAGVGAGAAEETLLKPAADPVRALVVREWMLLSRTPIWMLNNVLPGLIMPVAMFMPLLAQGQLRQLIDQMAANPQWTTIAGTALAAFLTFVGAVSGVAPTAISREGGRLWISRMIPQSAATQVKAKVVLASVVVGFSAAPTIVGFWLALRPPAVHILLPAAVGLLASFTVTCFGLWLDTGRPMLKWTHPQEPVKRNLNAMIPLVLALGLIAAGAAVTAAARTLGLDGLVVYALLLALSGVSAVTAYRILLSSAESRLGRLEL